MSKDIATKLLVLLRKRTGVGISKCKKALIDANSDIEEAIHILRKQGVISAAKKKERETNEGVIAFAENNDIAYIIEINAETDFAVQNERFKEFTRNIAYEALITRPRTIKDLLVQKYSKQLSLTIEEYRSETVLALGENIQIKRILDFSKNGNCSLGMYTHMGGKIVSVVIIEGARNQTYLARELAMHVVAASPDYLKKDQVPLDILKKEREIAQSQVQNRPQHIQDKIIQGKLNAFYNQSCFLNQNYIKDPLITVQQFIDKVAQEKALSLKVLSFVRWQIGT